jgi:hypothetical protein
MSPIVTPERTCPSASYDQCTHPLFASSAYTYPLSLLMKTAPPTTVGWLQAAAPAPGMANAHFNFNDGT